MRYGRAVCGDLAAAEAREWLLTNGRGGYAMGTVAGTLTRRYHGLLIAAVSPPVERRLIAARLELDVTYDGVTYELGTNRWTSGAIAPQGWKHLCAFELVEGTPAWTYACGDALIEVCYAMPYGIDATAVTISAIRARVPLDVRGRLIVADRDHHGGSLPDPGAFVVDIGAEAASVHLPACGRRLHVFAPRASFAGASERYAGYALPRESERGLQASDDYAYVLELRWAVAARTTEGVVISLEPGVETNAAMVLAEHRDRNAALGKGDALAQAADAFVVARGDGRNAGTTVIAGYPWFTDWGRDTMISLPGLFLATGRYAEAASVLRTFASHVKDGLIPNRFPDAGGEAEYNTIDASLWYIEAVRAYFEASGDKTLLRDVWASVRAIVDGYTGGTHYGIGVDEDGLVRGGADGVQLTWMDAKVGDHVVTPRRGKPVEISALWYNALRACEGFAERLGDDPRPFRRAAKLTGASMEKFWCAEYGWCYDVIEGPDGNDASLRPNQLLTVSLAASAFDKDRARRIVDVCASKLWTPMGLRTLSPDDARYTGSYGGDQTSRDGAYHMGTVWPWLLGPFIRAHLRAYKDRRRAYEYLAPLLDALDVDGIGTLPEIAEGDAPHAPRGCPAQAWSVAEALALRTVLL